MSQKIILFLSAMGSAADVKIYSCPDGQTVAGRQTNEAPVKYLLRKDPAISEILCLVTKKAKDSGAWEYFQSVMGREYPSLCLRKINYRSEAEGEKAKEELTNAPLEQILSYIVPGDRIYLETTGGTRDVVMFFLLLMRILSYTGVTPAGAVYSNFDSKEVLDVTYLTGLFDLVGGMQELTSFGSTRTLRRYYGNPARDGQVESLLRSAENLTESITLCRTEQLDERLDDFNRAVENAEACGDPLLRQLLPVFRKKFWDGRSMTIPGLIQWCLNSDMLQQALTIYKERMPGYLLSRKSLMEWKQPGQLDKEEDEKRRNLHQSKEEALFNKYFLTLESGYSPVRTLKHFEKVYQSRFLAVHGSRKKLCFVAMDYFYIRALRNMVNHASDHAEGDAQKELERYLKKEPRMNSQSHFYKPLAEVTASDVKQFVRDALENLKGK